MPDGSPGVAPAGGDAPDGDAPDGNAPEGDGALGGRNLLLGVSGGIAAYKTAPLVRLFKKAGAEVQVLMTESAERFVAPLTLGTLSGRAVLTEIFPETSGEGTEHWTKHVSLGRWADLFVVAPATAQTLAKLAGGFSDSMLTATALSARCPLLVCPSMDRDMYAHPAVRRNLRTLREDGCAVMPAAEGELASGLTGAGRLPEPEAIFARVAEMVSHGDEGHRAADGVEPARAEKSSHTLPHSLADRRVLVTAGPTREPIDPVRHLSSPSTGTMGFALAEAAARRGASVTLVAGPTALETPRAAPPGHVERVDVQTAREMHAAAQEHAPAADLVLMAAAVADYTPAEAADSKLKKDAQEGDDLTLRLHRTPDILAALGKEKPEGQCLLGFALETDDGPANARRKLREKNLDWIVLNSPTQDGSGFGTGPNEATLIGADGREEAFEQMPKRALADALVGRVATAFEVPASEVPASEAPGPRTPQ